MNEAMKQKIENGEVFLGIELGKRLSALRFDARKLCRGFLLAYHASSQSGFNLRRCIIASGICLGSAFVDLGLPI